MTAPHVADLTVDELRDLIREVVKETVLDLVNDPDTGLVLRDELKDRLRQSLEAIEAGEDTIPTHEVAQKLGLE